MFAILKGIAERQKKDDDRQAVLRFRSGAVSHVEEWIEVRTNLVKVVVNYSQKSTEVSFLPEAVESVEYRWR
jgi:hypothetical protein